MNIHESTIAQAKELGIAFNDHTILNFVVEKEGRRHARVKLTRNKIHMFLPVFTDDYHEAVFRSLALNAYVKVTEKGWPEKGVLWAQAELAEVSDVKVWSLVLTLNGAEFLTVFPPKPPEESLKLIEPATAEQIEQVANSKGPVSLT